MSPEIDPSETVGVRNPYAIAELKLDREIDWENEDARRVFEDVFGQSYETLFDPKHDSPLYEGIPLDGGSGPMVDGGFSRVEWRDQGTFLEGYPEYSDPIQGVHGGCYLHAALSAIAWTKPQHLLSRVSWIEDGTPDYVRITFTEDRGRGDDVMVEVTQELPTTHTGAWIYGRSYDMFEIWPGVYEKAYAKWKTGTDGDRPSIQAISAGQPAIALGELVGVEPTVWKMVDNSANVLWEVLTKASEGPDNAPANPMVARTYPSASDAPGNINYNNANVVANHAYTILGHEVRNGTQFVILRNPWGDAEANGGPSGWWNVTNTDNCTRIDLSNPNGVFGLPIGQFKQLFMRMALASP